MRQETMNSKVTFTGGYWYYFDIDGIKITAFGSGFSGKEIIYVNDDIVSEKRNYKFHSSHRIEVDGRHFEVSFEMKSMVTGELICCLFENGNLIATETRAYIQGNMLSNKWTLLGLFLFGALAGAGFITAGIAFGKMLANVD